MVIHLIILFIIQMYRYICMSICILMYKLYLFYLNFTKQYADNRYNFNRGMSY